MITLFSRRALRNLAMPTLLLVSACTTTDPQLGINVQTNALAQIIDVDPVYAGMPVEGSNGELQVEAVRRYKKGAVKAFVDTSLAKK